MLTSLLAIVSDAHLSALRVPEIASGEVAPPSAAERKLRLEEWAAFPLRTRDDVLAWRDARRLGKDARARSWPLGQGSSTAPDPSLGVGIESGMDGSETQIGGVGEGGDDGVMDGEGSLGTIQAEEFGNSLPTAVEAGLPTARSSSTVSGSGTLGLSKEFQDTFLW